MEITMKEAASWLASQDDLLILCHRNPDGDTLGSGYGLWHILKAMGKRAAIRCSDPLPKKLQYLAEGYLEEDFEPRAVVSVDIADQQLMGEGLSPWRDRVDLAIDHHPSNTRFAARLLLEGESAATCELICLLADKLGVSLTREMATCLYTGMATDTGCFKFNNTTPRTHRLAARLMETGIDYAWINRHHFDTKTRNQLALEQQVISNMEYHFDGAAALIILTKNMYQIFGVTEAEMDGVAAIPRKVEGVEVGITIKERGPQEYKISLRSAERVNVSAVCATLGGGGHYFAAGCTLKGPLPEVKARILEVVGKALEEQA